MIAATVLRGVALLIFFYPVRWLIRCCPWRWALKLGTLLGFLHALLFADEFTHRIREGIQAVQPDGFSAMKLRRFVRMNLVTRYKHLIDSFFYQHLDKHLIGQMVPTIEGRAYLDETLNEGKGAILLVSHFGSFGLLIGGLALRGYRLHQIFTLTPQSNYRTWRWVEPAIMKAKLRCWKHKTVDFEFWRPGMYLRPLYRRLLQGELLVLYGDGARGQRFTMVDFMGYPLSLSVGPFRIAARAQVALIPAFIIRQGEASHRVILEKPITLKGDDPASIQQGANRYASVLAHYVRTYPDQWFTWARLGWTVKAEERYLEFSTSQTNLSEFYHPRCTEWAEDE